MTDPTDISGRQNNDQSIALLRAVAYVHSHSQRLQTISLVASIAIAALGIVAALDRAFTPVAVLIGATWAVAYSALLAPWTAHQLRRAATLQEMLDTYLFRLPWNSVLVGEKVPADEVNRLSRNFTGDERRLRDYYLVPRVQPPHDVFFCLEQNLAWGPRARRRYAHLVMGILVVWGSAGLMVGFALQARVDDLVNAWFMPSLGLMLLCLDIYRAQTSAAEDRARVLAHLRVQQDRTRAGAPDEHGWRTFARQVQDTLFMSRNLQPRTPEWLFRHHHDADQADFRTKMRQLEDQVN